MNSWGKIKHYINAIREEIWEYFVTIQPTVCTEHTVFDISIREQSKHCSHISASIRDENHSVSEREQWPNGCTGNTPSGHAAVSLLRLTLRPCSWVTSVIWLHDVAMLFDLFPSPNSSISCTSDWERECSSRGGRPVAVEQTSLYVAFVVLQCRVLKLQQKN